MRKSTLQSLKEEAANHRAIADKIEEVIAMMEGSSTKVSSISIKSAPAKAPVKKVSRRGRKPGKKVAKSPRISQTDALIQSLSKATKPMTKQELFEAVVTAGCKAKSAASLAPILSKDTRFKSAGRGLWVLAASAPKASAPAAPKAAPAKPAKKAAPVKKARATKRTAKKAASKV